MDPKEIVRSGYDKLAHVYGAEDFERRRIRYSDWLARLTQRLPRAAEILDLGCGHGQPAAEILSRSFRVTGVDLSAEQVSLARRAVPSSEFVCADMTEVEFRPSRFDAVVALYSVIHVPLGEQPQLLDRLAGWLKPGGYLLVTVGHDAWTGSESDWLGVQGATMYWSHADGSTYRRWLDERGFRLLWEEYVPEGKGGHDILLATLEPRVLRAEELDLPEILALTHRAYARNVDLGFRYTGATEPMESLRQSWLKERVYKLVLGRRIVGSVRLVNVMENCLEVKRLCVEPACQRQGFGKQLLRFAEEEARKRGCSRLRLDTAKPFGELVEWYQRQGYQVVGETRFADVNYESVLMEKPLSAAGMLPSEIRRFEPRDQQAVLQLHREALEAEGAYAGDGPWDADLHAIEEYYFKGGGEFLVGVYDGALIAMGALQRTSPESAEIRRMRVKPGFQRRGIGGTILKALERRAKSLKCTMLHLDTTAGQAAAQRFYTKSA